MVLNKNISEKNSKEKRNQIEKKEVIQLGQLPLICLDIHSPTDLNKRMIFIHIHSTQGIHTVAGKRRH